MKKYLRAYLREKPLFFAFLRPKEASLYQPFKPFKSPILDVGCGDGFFAKIAFGKIDVGIDPDEKSIEEAKKRRVYGQAVLYDGKRIPFKDNYFATIVCNSTFEHITNLDVVLNEVGRVLKPNGLLYFTVPTNTWPDYLFGTFLFGNSYKAFFNKIQKHYNLYTLTQWSKKLAHAGLTITYHSYYLDNKKILWLFDIAHYLSISSIITKKIFNRWIMFPGKEKYLKGLENFIIKETSKDTVKGSCLFITAQKK